MSAPREEHIGFWRALAAAMQEELPVTEGLARARAELSGTAFDEVCEAMIGRIEGGATLSAALRELPDVFDARIVSAVAAGEAVGTLDAAISQIVAALAAGDLAALTDAQAAAGGRDDAGTVKLVGDVIREAVERRASDIHVEPKESGGGRIRLRIDGVLYEHLVLPVEQYAPVSDRLKIMAGLDLDERRLPQDGRILVKLGGQRHDLRVSTMPVIGGERVVCRVLVRQNIPIGLDQVGLSEEDLAKVRGFCRLPNGMVIVNGPTGCGKTTIIYSMLTEINRESCCVLTVEDPVEVAFDGVSQMQVRPSVGLTFARAIRSMLRQDPDVIMVGELRNLEMMHLCVQVAMTGHVVYTTLHAQTSVGAIRRLIDCGLEPFLVNSTLAGVITPRLARVLCPSCRKPAEPAAHSLPPEAGKILAAMKDATFYEPVGCEKCNGTGYRGRTGIYEILTVDDRIRQAVAEPLDMAALQDAARAAGMKTMLQDGLEKAARGITSVREVVRIAPQGRYA